MQEIFVYTLVAVCLGYALLTFIRQFKGSDDSGCAAGCGHCSAEKVSFDPPQNKSSENIVSSISFPRRD